MIICPICKSNSIWAGKKHNYDYYRCNSCNLLFAELSVDPKDIRSQNLDPEPRHTKYLQDLRLDTLRYYKPKAKKILDFGCGFGETGKHLRTNGIECFEVDLGTDLQLDVVKDGAVDGITILDVIEHITDPIETFNEFHRILKPGGVVLVETILCEKETVDWFMVDPTVHHVQMYTEKAMITLGSLTNFSVFKVNEKSFADSLDWFLFSFVKR